MGLFFFFHKQDAKQKFNMTGKMFKFIIEPPQEKICLCHMWTTEAQISLRIRVVIGPRRQVFLWQGPIMNQILNMGSRAEHAGVERLSLDRFIKKITWRWGSVLGKFSALADLCMACCMSGSLIKLQLTRLYINTSLSSALTRRSSGLVM